MITLEQLRNFVLVNSIGLSYGYLLYKAKTYDYMSIDGIQTYQTYIPVFGFILLKNVSLTYFFDTYSRKNHQRINSSLDINTKQEYITNNITNILRISLLDIIPIYFCSYNPNSENILFQYAMMIPQFFMFEIVFDFFHYWSHRIMHQKHLYKIHKYHHQDKANVSAYSTYKHTFLDIIFTNTIPMLITSRIIRLSEFNFMNLIFYKTYVEIGGHLGCYTRASSFPQFMWLPRLFNIEATCTDHYQHHVKFNVNYSKRFVLWDKLFGTYQKYK